MEAISGLRASRPLSPRPISQITKYLLGISLLLCIVIFAVLMATPDPDGYVVPGGQSKIIRSLSVTIVILVASIPIAIEVVCTSTLAVGSHIMSAVRRSLEGPRI